MRRLRTALRLVASALLLVAVTACSSPDQPPPRVEPEPQPEPEPVPPLAPPDAPPAEPVPPADAGEPELVEPRPGMVDVEARPWDEAFVLDQGRTVELRYWSGVEPCSVLDHVDVDYADEVITLTLFEGREPSDEPQACIEIAVYKAVRVALEEPVGTRSLADGAEL